MVGSLAQPRYPDIDAAEGALRSALASLHNAERLINRAIGQLEIAKQFAAAHGY